jgi:DNA-binding CsgD family transcriptional regulator
MMVNPALENGQDAIPKRVNLNRKFEDRKPRRAKAELVITPELTYDAPCRRRRKLYELSLKEKLEIAHKYLIQHYSLADIAILHQVKPSTIRTLAKRIEKDD